MQALQTALEQGHALVLFDGLDEVPDAQRDFVRESITSFETGGFRDSRMVVTCRAKSYELRGLRLPGFKDHTLAEFSADQVRQFVVAWYRECGIKGYQGMTPDEATLCVPSLVKALSNPRLDEMARNPLHLTAMACLHTARAGQPLPEESARLFDLLVDTLLFFWAKAKTKGAGAEDGPDELGALLKDGECSERKLRSSLERLAFQAHRAGFSVPTGTWQAANISEDTLKLELAKLDAKGRRLEWAEKVIEAIRHRSGLLQSDERDPHSFQFTYRFQEFLAGGYLADKDAWERDHQPSQARGHTPSFAHRAAALFDPAGYWRNVITWAAGLRAHVMNDLGDVRDLIHELCQVAKPPPPPERRRLGYAADLVREVRLKDLLDLRWGPETVTDLRARLTLLVDDPQSTPDFPLKERAEIAAQLGHLGDERPGVGTRPRPGKQAVPDLSWTDPIVPNDFIMGGQGANEGHGQFTHRLDHEFRMAIYPVTVAQYELFVGDGGYERQDLWTEAGWKWRAREHRKRPADYAGGFQTPNHPRVGVSWYEAVAFSKWLNLAFSAEDLRLPPGWQVRLPSEAEWERAARHTDGRKFPWKEEAEPASRCNCDETGLRETSAVGLFPSGRAECGAMDMAGNVWEWTRSLWGEDWQKATFNYPYGHNHDREDLDAPSEVFRVLRGGAWFFVADDARCAYRFGAVPVFRGRVIGFRVVASPFCSEL
ncbi:MAG: SUMF1/EgtB/PvdO family nonheme iron enzyme [Limisphaerales bacterium]